MPRRWKVLLCGYYGMGNSGDEFLASAAIRLLERCGVDRSQIAMLSGSTAESERLHGVAAVDRWSLKNVLQAASGSETLLLGGGGIFQDSSGPISPLYYWGVMKLASLCGCNVWAVGQSIGPLKRRFSRLLAQTAFGGCKAVTVRDRHSFDFLSGRALLADDLVLTLPEDSVSVASGENVLVNFRPCGGLERESARVFSQMPWRQGKKVVGIAMSKEDADLMETLCKEGLLTLDELRSCTVDSVGTVFSDAACACGMRLHFGVMCLKKNIPCVLIPYDPKVSDFALRWGCGVWRAEGGSPQPWSNRSLLDEAVENTFASFKMSFEKAMRA